MLASPATNLTDLDSRSREIFRKLVETFLDTGEPVGSRKLSHKLATPLSSASVRNVMTDLEALGLIYAPHVSAGRIPTDEGLRFFVDAFLEFGNLSREEQEQIEVRVQARSHPKNTEQLLTEASQMLSKFSSGAGLVVTHNADARLQHVEFVRIDPTRALVVLVFEGGAVENRLIDLPAGLPASTLVAASNVLTHITRRRTLKEARLDLEDQLKTMTRELDKLTARVVKAGIARWSGEGESRATLIVRGLSNLLGSGDEEIDLERIRLLFDDLESKREMAHLLRLAETGEGVRIFIGSENRLFSMSGSSLIISPYRDRDCRIVGVLGVIGPTRLNYARIVPMVDYTAKIVGRLLD